MNIVDSDISPSTIFIVDFNIESSTVNQFSSFPCTISKRIVVVSRNSGVCFYHDNQVRMNFGTRSQQLLQAEVQKEMAYLSKLCVLYHLHIPTSVVWKKKSLHFSQEFIKRRFKFADRYGPTKWQVRRITKGREASREQLGRAPLVLSFRRRETLERLHRTQLRGIDLAVRWRVNIKVFLQIQRLLNPDSFITYRW